MGNGTWRIARSRGGAHLPLVIVAALAVALILIGKAQSSLFDRVRTGVVDWMRPALVSTRTPMETLNRWMGSFGEIFVIYQENLRLKEENARLRQWHNTALVLNDRIKRYQLLLHAVPDPALSSVVARVIGRASHPFLQTMILDAGKSSGIKPGQAVVDQRGMIGRVFLTGERTSWVILLTDLNSRIPVSIESNSSQTEPSTTQAIMAGDNSFNPVIETLAQARDVQFHDGDQVITSGDGDILPAGIQIGVVVVEGSHYRVALFADQTTAQDVQILDFKQKPEHPPSASQNDLPVTAAGLRPAAPMTSQGLPAPQLQPVMPQPVFKPSATPQIRSAPPADDGGDNDVPDNGNQ
jgi:rod shape-determining protein MreC